MRAPALSLLVAVFAANTALVANTALANIPDPRFTETTVLSSGISGATGLARAPDGTDRIFIVTKEGDVHVLENGALAAGTFATISPIYTGSECGLLGVAFDPDYTTNGYVYFFVTVSGSEQQIIRYTDVAGLGQDKTTIVPGLPTVGANHDGGGIGFGPDGYLYWSIGDNGSGRGTNNDLTLLASKVGRAKADGTVPTDNPFFDGPGPNDDYIWARGFRNPFTLTFEPGRGRLWVNTVGSSYEQVFIVHGGDHMGWNTYENDQPMNYVPPAIVYRTNSADQRFISASGAVRSGGVITITTSNSHGFRRGQNITLSGISDASFNGTVYVRDTPTSSSFTADQPGPDAMSGNGSAQTQSIGGCITGGTFLDSNDASAEFAGNFVFGDYNSDLLMRATLDANGDITTIDQMGSSFGSIVDTETGPDGALYVLGHGGQLRREAFNHSAQALVVSATHLRLTEGGRIGFSVRLATEPVSNVAVTVRNSGADPDVMIETGATLTFTNANWDQPQRVVLYGGLDFDTDEDRTTVSVESTGLANADLEVTVRDLNSQSIVLTTTTLTVGEGMSTMVGVSLSDSPDANVTITVTSTSPKILIAAGEQLTFSEQNFSVPQNVVIATFEDQDATNDVATIIVSAHEAAPRTLAVHITDNDTIAPMFTSTSPTIGVAGKRYEYDAEASGLPTPVFALVDSPSGATFDPATGMMGFLPFSAGTYNFTVRASNGVPPNATQSWSVAVVEDQPPTVMITKPQEGATLSGIMNEWYGTASDDVGLIRAEFAIDGELAFTESSSIGRYNFMGGPMRFDTTTLSNGAHTLKLTVLDTKRQMASSEIHITVSNQSSSADGGVVGPPPGGETADKGCGCSTTERRAGSVWAALFLLALSALSARRGGSPYKRRDRGDPASR